MKNIHLPSLEFVSPKEIEIHYKRPLFKSMLHIKSSIDADKYFREFTRTERLDYKEFFWVMFLSYSSRVLAFSEIGSGKADVVVVNIREVLQLALLTNASAFILFHNHPSGKLEISETDMVLTKKMKEASEFIDLRLLDHIIITSESYVSFSDKRKL